MKIPWKVIIYFALFLTVLLTVLEFVGSSKGHVDLTQYEVEKLNPNIGIEVLDKVASQSDKVFTYSEDIGKVDK